MQKKPKKYQLDQSLFVIIILISVFLTKSCYRDPMNIDFDEFGKKVVIEGNLNNQSGALVIITKTIDYNSNGTNPVVENANVAIEDENGLSHELTEIQPGVYRNYSFRGIPENRYKLTIIFEYEKYIAYSTMPQPLYLETMNFNRIEPGSNYYSLSFSFQDHDGKENYCIIRLHCNGSLIDQYLYNDSQHDGELISVDYYNTLFYLNDLVTIEMKSIDKVTYDFFHTLDIIEEREADEDELAGTFIPVTTYNPTTNINNGALGYFSANSTTSYSRRAN